MNYYEILRVSPNCDAKGLEAAYHHLAKTHHPDHNKDADTSKFSEIAEAYRILRNPDKRAEYDRLHGLNDIDAWTAFSSKGDQWIDAEAALDDAEAHAKILAYLYRKRRENPQDAGVIAFYLQEIVGCSHEELEFHKWYLKEKGFVVTTEQGTMAITIEGIDHVMSTSRTVRAEKLLIGRSNEERGD